MTLPGKKRNDRDRSITFLFTCGGEREGRVHSRRLGKALLFDSKSVLVQM